MTRMCRPDARLRALPLIAVLVLGCLGASAPAVAQDADHLILSEIVTTVNRFGARFIEIVNPTGAAVALDDVYLTTGTNVTNGAGYWRIVEALPTSATAGGGTGGTFHGRFPAGAMIAAGDTIAISVTGSGDFAAAYGYQPDFEVFEDGLAADAVPELVEVFPGSINAGSLAGGTNAVTLGSVAGSVAMYRWDGSDELVADLDYAHWGINTGFRVDKSGYTFGASNYLADTGVGTQIPLPGSANDGRSYMRNSASEGTEATPGNGATGHDETSEALNATWAVVQPQAPAAPPATWLPTAPIFGGLTLDPATPNAAGSTAVTLALASNSVVTGLSIHYTVDGGAPQTVAAGAAGGGAWTADVPAQAEGAVVAWWAEATNTDGGSAVYPAAAPRFVQSWVTAAAPEPTEPARKLLITEVNAGVNFYPNYGGIADLAMEFIEIHNPGDSPVDLSNYFLTDAINYGNTSSQLYWQITAGIPSTYARVGGGNYNDFHARFPLGYTIPASGTIVIALAGSDGFYNVYGVEPDLELYEDAAAPDAIPDMRPVFGEGSVPRDDSIYTPGRTAGSDGLPRGIPELEEFYGEPVILYHWNEGDLVVTDVDIFILGDEKTGSYRVSFDKTNVTYSGGSYLPDTAVDLQEWFTETEVSGTKSYTRIVSDDDEGMQTPSGSNGVDGRDETSEKWPQTFAMLNPTPGFYLAAIGGGSTVDLDVPARTFMPALGEKFRIEFVSKVDSDTKLRVFDLNGRLVVTLFDSRFDGAPSTVAGYPEAVLWDGRDDTYERVPAGMYILHLSAVERATGAEETRTAPVVVSTRLSK